MGVFAVASETNNQLAIERARKAYLESEQYVRAVPFPELYATIRQRLRYDPDSGIIYWRDGPRRGKEAGGVGDHGYKALTFKHPIHRRLLAHRVAWVLYYGQEPPFTVDHINGIRTDNRICNLRAATERENAHNKPWNRAGIIPGVHKRKRCYRWTAVIWVGGRKYHLGAYDTREKALAAYNSVIA